MSSKLIRAYITIFECEPQSPPPTSWTITYNHILYRNYCLLSLPRMQMKRSNLMTLREIGAVTKFSNNTYFAKI